MKESSYSIQIMKEIKDGGEVLNFRNLRDITNYSNPNIKPNMLFRSSDLSAYENDPSLSIWLNRIGIKTIIDLRNRRDIMRRTYSPKILKNIKYRNIKLVSDETDEEIDGRDSTEYYSWVLHNEGKKLEELFIILSDRKNFPLVIHCHIGMDRTGIILALIHLLLETPNEKIIEDYLASGLDMKLELIELILQIINNNGGINQYLNKQGISNEIQAQIVRNLTI